jgi:hypothetical protein
MKNVFDACIVKDPPRKDIIWEYTEYLHERICEILKKFWDENFRSIESVNLLQLTGWFDNYSNEMAAYFTDDRLKMSIESLLSIYNSRSIESCEPVVSEIVHHEKTALPFENETGILVTSAPIDLFKLLNEGLDAALKQCNIKEV